MAGVKPLNFASRDGVSTLLLATGLSAYCAGQERVLLKTNTGESSLIDMENQGGKRRQHSSSAGSAGLPGESGDVPQGAQHDDEMSGSPERTAPGGPDTATPGSGQQDRTRARIEDEGARHYNQRTRPMQHDSRAYVCFCQKRIPSWSSK